MGDLTHVRRRSAPRVVLLDEDLQIAFGDSNALTALRQSGASPNLHDLPARFTPALERSIARAREVPGGSIVTEAPGLILRVCSLNGPAGAYTAVFVEHAERADGVAAAALRYRLSPRERQVLELIMQGCNAERIAERLAIARSTVHDYFKNLLRKTESRNRSEMIARVLDWGGASH